MFIMYTQHTYQHIEYHDYCLTFPHTHTHRIKEVADKINKYGSQTPQILQSLKAPVKQVVIGPSHLGLLLEDGRALRVAFSVIPERLDLSKGDQSKS